MSERATPFLQIGPQGLTARPSNRQIGLWRTHFATRHFVRFPALLEPGLLERVVAGIRDADFYERIHDGVGVELCLSENSLASQILHHVANDPTVRSVATTVADTRDAASFSGRVFRLTAVDHYDSWHTDCADDRLVALSLNLSPDGYSGGHLQIRRRDSADLVEVPNTEFGDAVLFRVDPDFEHQISEVTGLRPRTAFAGWFRASPDDFGGRLRRSRGRSDPTY